MQITANTNLSVIRRPVGSTGAFVEKIENFGGELSNRNLYIFLPPNYDQAPPAGYPVLYMHDGQNCFESFAEDSFAGTWWADVVAANSINKAEIPPIIIVAVSHGEEERIPEYLPTYALYQPPTHQKSDLPPHKQHLAIPKQVRGRAYETARYYEQDVQNFVRANYHVTSDRSKTATCGSSMGGLFSLYMAWEHPDFAQNHAALSASIWITQRPDDGKLALVERLRTGRPRDVRIWLDSGTQDRPGHGDDNSPGVMAARDALIENGYRLGNNLAYLLDEGATHTESAWAGRFDQVLKFLFAT